LSLGRAWRKFDWPGRSVILQNGDSVFGVVELQSVHGVVELRCAGRFGPGRREWVGRGVKGQYVLGFGASVLNPTTASSVSSNFKASAVSGAGSRSEAGRWGLGGNSGNGEIESAADAACPKKGSARELMLQ